MSANVTPRNISEAARRGLFKIADPGNGKALPFDETGIVHLVSTGAETRTLAAPTNAGTRLGIAMDTDGGTVTLTVTGAVETADASIAFADAKDYVVFESIKVGTSHYWARVAKRLLASTEPGVAAMTSTIAQVDAVASGSSVTGHGAGVIGTGVAPSTRRFTRNGEIITEIKVDLEGLASVATANDVIGLSAGGNAYIGQNVVASNGIIYKIELICLETPAGGDNDVNVVAASSGTLAYDGAGGTTYGVNGGDAVAGQVVQNLIQGLTANHYFYLTAGTGDTAAAYTGGQFLIRLYGHPVLT